MKPKYTDRYRYPEGYVPSHETDVGVRFRRLERERREREAEAKRIAAEAEAKVEQLSDHQPLRRAGR